MYNTIYELMMNAFYGVSNMSALTGWQDLTLTLLATFCIVFIFAIPFIVVIKIVRSLTGF